MGSRYRSLRRQLIAAAILAWVGIGAHAACAPDKVTLRGAGAEITFNVEIADTAQERNRGLMFRRAMKRDAGMLFLYNRPRAVTFWMKNTYIPLDLIFLDRTGVVTHVHPNAVPHDLTPIPGGRNVQAVLEINGGLAALLRIMPGSQMQHAAFAQDAAWPCPN